MIDASVSSVHRESTDCSIASKSGTQLLNILPVYSGSVKFCQYDFVRIKAHSITHQLQSGLLMVLFNPLNSFYIGKTIVISSHIRAYVLYLQRTFSGLTQLNCTQSMEEEDTSRSL